jgi:hypothetical protein
VDDPPGNPWSTVGVPDRRSFYDNEKIPLEFVAGGIFLFVGDSRCCAPWECQNTRDRISIIGGPGAPVPSTRPSRPALLRSFALIASVATPGGQILAKLFETLRVEHAQDATPDDGTRALPLTVFQLELRKAIFGYFAEPGSQYENEVQVVQRFVLATIIDAD